VIEEGGSTWSLGKAASERKPEASPRGDVEDFVEPRTKLEAMFSIS